MKCVSLILAFLAVLSHGTRTISRQQRNPLRIAFGSCFNLFDSRSDIFKSISQYDPQIFVWLGDFAYTDVMPIPLYFNPGSQDYTYQRFNLTFNDPYYAEFRQANRTILGTMDDHDYGLNNAGASNPVKDFNKRLFLEAIEQPEESIRWTEGRGLYQDYIITHGDLQIHLILTDGRYYMEPENKMQNAPFLGQEQWVWLEQIFATTNSDLYLVGSGVQFLLNYRWATEGWHRHQKQRFLDLIEKYRKNNVVFLTGDIHFFQFYKSICPVGGSAGYYLYEATSSGLSHVATDYIPFADHFSRSQSPRHYQLSQMESILNFGTIEITSDSAIRIQFRGIENNVMQSLDIDLETLKFAEQERFQSDIFDCTPLNMETKHVPALMSLVFHLFKEEVPAAMAYLTVYTLIFTTLISSLGYPVYRVLFLTKKQIKKLQLN